VIGITRKRRIPTCCKKEVEEKHLTEQTKKEIITKKNEELQ
jgi:hypothetical protein